MTHTIPQVEESLLVAAPGVAGAISVGTPAWYEYLDQAVTFAFVGRSGSFTARKERHEQAGWYWKAYRKHAGLMRSADLGTSADLTLGQLNAVARTLAQHAIEAPPAETSATDPALLQSDGEPATHIDARLPIGTITFLFTDIEGSSIRWEQHPQAMASALAHHDQLLRDLIATHAGAVFKTVGDSVHAAFARAADAVAAAYSAQLALRAQDWGDLGSLPVRMALHSGAAELRDGDYFGPPLNRIARILALGHGGQILLSHATHHLVADDLPAQIGLRDLGEYPLKDLSRPEQIFQLLGPHMPADFPPLRTLDTQSARPTPEAMPLLATKLYIPAPRPQLVLRRRLEERVQAGLQGKLTLIAAPAGFGKTTLLSAWLAARTEGRGPRVESVVSPIIPQSSMLGLQVAWVSLDTDDNDPRRFWSYVLAALEKVYPTMDTAALALLRSPQPPPIEVVVTSLINAISPIAQAAALVLDDYHLIATPAIHASIAFLLDHLPPQLHVIMLTRADPPLPLTRLRTRGELTELRAADLRFSADEAAAFLTEIMGLTLTGDQVVALEHRTEGWIAGLQLAALAMQNRTDYTSFVAAFSGSNRFVVDYLAEEVLSRLPAHLQTFVLQTSILDRLCGSLCDAVLGVTNSEVHTLVTQRSPLVTPAAYSQLILDQIERANLFLIPLDDERLWYRYHHLFAEVLRERLRSGAASNEVAKLYQRASTWHEQAGMISEAVRYAFLAQDAERAAALIEQHGMAIILSSSDVFLVRGWLEQLPNALVLARPRLVVIAGSILGVLRQFDAFERLLEDAAPALSATDLAPNTLGELGLLHTMIARYKGDSAGTLAYAQQALAQLDQDNHSFRALAALNIGVAFVERADLVAAKAALDEAISIGELGGQWAALSAMEELMSLQQRQGQIRAMFRTADQALDLSARLGGRPIPATGMGYVGMAEALYEWNDLAGVIHAATQGVELLRWTVESLLLVRGYIVLAQAAQAQGDHAGALASIARGVDWLAKTQIAAPRYLGLLAASQARLWLQQGNPGAAARWEQEYMPAGDSELGYIQQLTLVRLRLAQSRAGEASLGDAHAILAQLLPLTQAREWTRYLIEGLMLQALVYQRQADRSGALSTLERALTLAEPEGFIRLFVDEGAPLAELLGQIAGSRSPVTAYAANLLKAFPEAGEATRGQAGTQPARSHEHPGALAPGLAPAMALVEPLSVRELEVLRLIANGRSNQEIADTLIIAVSTVKRHINNIYGKLAVQSRTQALLRAQELKLL